MSRQAIAQTAQRWAWEDRAAAWDAQQTTPLVVMPIRPRAATEADQPGMDAEGWASLEAFRAEAELLGKTHVRLARGLSAVATKNAARMLKSEKPLSPRDIAALATTSAQLATAGTTLWAKAVGIERLMSGMEHLARGATDAEVLDAS